ncbi:MAG: ribonuclease [Lachnospiraceae bacterium]|nr:ribonuclease [Lachnospiraceae bacterium]
MEQLINIIKNYKKHPILATIIVLAVVGLLAYGLYTASKDNNTGGDVDIVTVTPTENIKATDTPVPATPTESQPDTPTPTTAGEPTKAAVETPSPVATPTTEPTATATPTEKAATPTATPKPTNTPTPTVTPKPTKTPTPTVTPKPTKTPTPTVTPKQSAAIDEDGWYYDKDSVALYIHTYGHLPGNYITKKEAEALGWSGGSVDKYAKGKVIGGDYFGNYEGLLPQKNGRKYTECDIDTKGKSRGAKRIIFSNDGLIFYTDDHYETFTQLY